MTTTTARRRYEPTEAQRAASLARREAFKVLAKRVADLTDDERAALAARTMPRTIEGRPLSPHNACLLAFQLPTVTIVGGFRQWKAAGRHVRKGEHGLIIWVPTARTIRSDETDGETRRPGFIAGTVFDVSQTDETGDTP